MDGVQNAPRVRERNMQVVTAALANLTQDELVAVLTKLVQQRGTVRMRWMLEKLLGELS